MTSMRDRFNREIDKPVQEYTESIHFDKRLYYEEGIAGSIYWNR